jgi:hypothetical protein
MNTSGETHQERQGTMSNLQKVDLDTRRALVERVEAGEISAADAAREAGVKPPTVGYWIKQERKLRGEPSPLDLVDPAQGLAAKIRAKKSAAAAGAKEELRKQQEDAVRVVQNLAEADAEIEHLEAAKAQIEAALAGKRADYAEKYAAALGVFDKAALKRQGYNPPAQAKSKRNQAKQPESQQEQSAEHQPPPSQNGSGWDGPQGGQQPYQYDQSAEAGHQLGT